MKSTLKIISIVITLLSGMAVFLNAEAKPVWGNESVSLGSLSAKGGVSRQFHLGRLSGSPEFPFDFSLQHQIEEVKVRNGTRTQSSWHIPELSTSLVPGNRNTLIWTAPGGQKFQIGLDEVQKGRGSPEKEDWAVYETDTNTREVRFKSGWVYQYRDGGLSRITAPSGRQLRVTARDGQIHRISQSVNNQNVDLLQVTYNRYGQPVQMVLGPIRHSFEYNDATGQLVSWTNNRLVETGIQFAYTNGLISAIEYPGGHSETYEWQVNTGDWMNRGGLELPRGFNSPLLVRDSHNEYFWGVDRSGIHLIRSDKQGRRESVVINPLRNLVTRVAFDGTETVFQWSANGRGSKLESVRGPDGNTLVRMEYDDLGRVIERHQAGGPSLTFHYDASGRLEKVVRGGQYETLYEYRNVDSKLPARVTNSEGHSVEMRHNEEGRVTWMRDLNGGEHLFYYDAWGRVREHHYPLGYRQVVEYDQYGRITRQTKLDGSEVEVEFNDQGLVSMVKDMGTVYEYHYNQYGQLERLVRDQEDWMISSWETDEDGLNRHILVDARGRETIRDFNHLGQVIRMINPLQEITEYRYDEVGELLGWIDARGSVVKFEKDIMGRMVKQTNSLDQEIHWAYNDFGMPVEKRTGEQTIRYHYNREGQLEEIDYGLGQKVVYERDNLGRVINARNNEVSTRYAYDSLDRVIAVRQELLGGDVSGLLYQYAPSGQKSMVAVYQSQPAGREYQYQLTSAIGSAGRNTIQHTSVPGRSVMGDLVQVTEYQFDQLGRRTAVLVDGVMAMRYEYDRDTLRLARRVYANGMSVHYSYYADGKLAEMRAVDVARNEIARVVYLWNKYGELTDRWVDGVHQKYQYDQLGRLIAVNCPERPKFAEEYRYDASGNLIFKSVGGEEVSMTYDLANQLVSQAGEFGEKSFYYDTAGRLAKEILEEGDIAEYTYGYLDKVLSVSRGKRTVQFHYDAMNMMVGKSVSLGEQESWLWDGIALVARGNNLYANEDHISGGVPVLAKDLTSREQKVMLNDYLGTTMAMFSLQHSEATENNEYGISVQLTSLGRGMDQGVMSTARFTGKPYDEDMGAFVFPFRNYRADLGRWMSADPAGFPDGSNGHFYAPVPTIGLDPLGLEETQYYYQTFMWTYEHEFYAEFAPYYYPNGDNLLVTYEITPGPNPGVLIHEVLGVPTATSFSYFGSTQTMHPPVGYVPPGATYVRSEYNANPSVVTTYTKSTASEYGYMGVSTTTIAITLVYE